jgi:serine/threonine protein kinase
VSLFAYSYTETVDVYSYAMILYYLLGGKPPWPTLNGIVAVEKAALDGERPPIPRDWDMRLSKLLQQCWDENPQNRPPFGKIIQILDAYSADVFKQDQNSVDGSTGMEADTRCLCTIL